MTHDALGPPTRFPTGRPVLQDPPVRRLSSSLATNGRSAGRGAKTFAPGRISARRPRHGIGMWIGCALVRIMSCECPAPGNALPWGQQCDPRSSITLYGNQFVGVTDGAVRVHSQHTVRVLSCIFHSSLSSSGGGALSLAYLNPGRTTGEARLRPSDRKARISLRTEIST